MDEQLVRYENFDLQIVREGRKYCGRVLSSPAGSGAESRFTLPFSAAELQQMRSLHLPDLPTIQHFGKTLYERVCADQVRTLLISCLNDLQQAAMNQPMGPQLGLRIRIRCVHVPELATLPWEYLYVTELGQFLGLCERVTIVRYLDVARPTEPLPVQPPLRMLVLTASPSDYPLLNVDQEWQRLQASLQPLTESGLLQLAYLEKATFAQVRRQLAQGPFHILHYIGHGGLEARSDRGVLILENEQGESQQISGLQLTQLLANQTSLKLVVLNACEGARTLDNDTFAGIAQSLVLGGIPAVIAMQFVITDAAATHFSPEFYGCLARGLAIDSALLQARITLFTQPNEAEWGTPVLFLRTDDGVIFALEKTTPSLSIASRSSTTSIEQPALVAEPVESPPMSPSEAVPADSATQIPQIPQPLPPAHPKSLSERFIQWLGRLDPTQIAVAIITAIVGPIIIYLVTTTESSPLSPTPLPAVITPSVIAPGMALTATAPMTPSILSANTTAPTAEPTRLLRVGFAPFTNCQNVDSVSQLVTKIRANLNPLEFAHQTLPAIGSQTDARIQKEQDIVIWGSCDNANQILYQAEVLLNDLDTHRVAEPATITFIQPQAAVDVAAKLFAALIAYHTQSSTDTSVVLLMQTYPQWAERAEHEQSFSLHWLLGNALLGHVEHTMYPDAQNEYELALQILHAQQGAHVAEQAKLLNNLGRAYAQQANYSAAVTPLTQAIALDPAYAWAYIQRAEARIALTDEGSFAAARQDCGRAIVVAKAPVNGYICRIWAYWNFGFQSFHDEIRTDAEQALRMDDDHALAYLVVSIADCLAGQADRAILHYQNYERNLQFLDRWEQNHPFITQHAQYLLTDYQARHCP
jgi:tetratricopeptide (TPR) repeat protein